MQRTGRCICGKVSYSATLQKELSACHCSTCLRWSSGPLLAVGCQNINWTGSENITTFASSAWAERGFCNQCGSNLFYRVTANGKFCGFTSLAYGTLDDRSAVSLTREWFIDEKPDAYAFAGERAVVTAKEAAAMLAAGSEAITAEDVEALLSVVDEP